MRNATPYGSPCASIPFGRLPVSDVVFHATACGWPALPLGDKSDNIVVRCCVRLRLIELCDRSN